MSRLVRSRTCRDRKSKRGTGSCESGQSLVETALVVPILLLLLAAIIDFGRAFDTYIVLTNAAREGARFASLANPIEPAQIRDLVYDDVVGSGMNITDMSTFKKGDIILEESTDIVTVTVPYTMTLWFGGLIGVDQLPLQKTAVMPRAEY
jgi:Flp pilus assembly protein TadG